MTWIYIILAVIAIAGVLMLFKWPGAALGYIYCVGTGTALSVKLIGGIARGDEIFYCLLIGAGIGAVFGLAFAVGLHSSHYSIAIYLIGALLLPILMVIVGFFLILALGIVAMFMHGDGDNVIISTLIMVGLIGGIVGGGGSILVIILDN